MSFWLKNSLQRLFRRKRPASVEALQAQGHDRATAEIIVQVRSFTMTSNERIAALCQAVEYVVKHQIAGDFVECGVWKGGSMMAVALMLQKLGAADRQLRLLDTFEGMPPPTDADVAISGEKAERLLQSQRKEDPASVWCVSRLSEVRANLAATNYPPDRIHYVVGRVEQTLPAAAPEKIALLRLDTDWYQSTRCELEHLFPRLEGGGVLIVDDYGHWQGAKRAVDEYFQERRTPILLHRIDYTGRIAVKPFGMRQAA